MTTATKSSTFPRPLSSLLECKLKKKRLTLPILHPRNNLLLTLCDTRRADATTCKNQCMRSRPPTTTLIHGWHYDWETIPCSQNHHCVTISLQMLMLWRTKDTFRRTLCMRSLWILTSYMLWPEWFIVHTHKFILRQRKYNEQLRLWTDLGTFTFREKMLVMSE